MSDSFYDLIERISDAFSEIDSDIVTDLGKNNEEYAELRNRLSGMRIQHRFIDDIFEGDGALTLTADERAILTEYIRLRIKLDAMERKQIYFRGHTDGYAYLKRIEALQ